MRLKDIPNTKTLRTKRPPRACHDCGRKLSRNAKWKCVECYRATALRKRCRPPVELRDEGEAPSQRTIFEEMDHNFWLAMMAAVNAGRERPPGMGICTEPGTQYPIFMEGPRPIRSFANEWMMEMGEGGHW